MTTGVMKLHILGQKLGLALFKGIDPFSGVVPLPKQFSLPSEKDCALKGKNLLPVGANSLGANSFLLEQTPFQKETDVHESKQEVTDIVSLEKWWKTLPWVSDAIHYYDCC